MKKILIILCALCYSCSTQQKLKTTSKKNQSYAQNGERYAIATQGDYASEAARKMFNLGGNAIDAAIAASFTISVERPHSSGLGGGGFMLINHPEFEQPMALDCRESAPALSTERMYQDKKGDLIKGLSTIGAKSSGTPGLVAGLIEVHRRFGVLPLSTVMVPAIDLAENGFKVYDELAIAIERQKENIRKYESSQKIFFKDSTPLKLNDILIQKDLAATLKRIAQTKGSDFYFGFTAKKIAASQKKWGGLISLKDLGDYKTKWRMPIEGSYRGHKIFSMPPPSSGGVHIVQMLNMLENYEFNKDDLYAARNIHTIAEVMKRAFWDRSKYLGDSDYVKVPVKGLISKRYAKNLFKRISKDKTTLSSDLEVLSPHLYESDHTTHLTIAEKKGFVVTTTQTINGLFGSALVAEGSGVIMNNEMDDFSAKPNTPNLYGAIGGRANSISPYKRPLSSMSPTLVYDSDENLTFALGSPNGTRIITCVLLAIINTIDFNQSPIKAISQTRFHHQWYPDELRVDAPFFSDFLEQDLKDLGHKIVKKPYNCRVNGVGLNNQNKLFSVIDPRGAGMAISQ